MNKHTEQLVALKPLKYQTRRLMAGESFSASPNDARLLIAVKKAARGRALGELPVPPEGVVATARRAAPAKKAAAAPAEDLTALRQAYKAKVGKQPYNGWDAEELKRRMDAAE